MFTIYSLYIHYMLTIYSRHVHYMLTLYSQIVKQKLGAKHHSFSSWSFGRFLLLPVWLIVPSKTEKTTKSYRINNLYATNKEVRRQLLIVPHCWKIWYDSMKVHQNSVFLIGGNKKVPIFVHYFSSRYLPNFILAGKVVLLVCIKSTLILFFPALTINKTPLN